MDLGRIRIGLLNSTQDVNWLFKQCSSECSKTPDSFFYQLVPQSDRRVKRRNGPQTKSAGNALSAVSGRLKAGSKAQLHSIAIGHDNGLAARGQADICSAGSWAL